MHWLPHTQVAVHSKAAVLLFLNRVVYCLVLFLVLQTSGWGIASSLLYFVCLLCVLCFYCSVALPHDAVGWSAVCDCGIS